MPDLMEGLDVLAALKGTDKVLLDTVMQPEVVEEKDFDAFEKDADGIKVTIPACSVVTLRLAK